MANVYVDTSSLVKFYYPEEESERIEAILLKADRVYISYLTVVEMASAFSKKVRMGELRKNTATVLWNTFLDDIQTTKIDMLLIEERHYIKAADFIRELGWRDGIKTLDAIHLSMAHSLPYSKLLCSDSTLVKAAKKIGIKLV